MKQMLLWSWCRGAGRWAGLVAGAGLGLAVAETPPPPADGLTLDDAIRLALEHHPELRAAAARVDAAAGRARQARPWTNPELAWNAEDWPVGGGGGFADAKQTLGLAQTFPFPGKKAADREIGGVGMKQSSAELALRQTEVVREVKGAFFRVLAAEQWVAVSTQLVAVAESFATTARKRVEAGAAPYQEQLRAEVQWEQAQTELAGYQRERTHARQWLATLLGRPEGEATRLAGALAETPDARLLETPEAGRLDGHPGLRAAQAALDRAELEHRRARLEPYPDVKVGVAGGRVGATGESIIELGVSLPLPLFDRGKGRQQEARANVTVAEADLQGVRQALSREWADARERYRTAVEQVARYRERILPKATEALRLVQTGFEQGKFGFIDLVDTQRTTAEARLAYQGKLLELNLAQAGLEALLPPPAGPIPAP